MSGTCLKCRSDSAGADYEFYYVSPGSGPGLLSYMWPTGVEVLDHDSAYICGDCIKRYRRGAVLRGVVSFLSWTTLLTLAFIRLGYLQINASLSLEIYLGLVVTFILLTSAKLYMDIRRNNVSPSFDIDVITPIFAAIYLISFWVPAIGQYVIPFGHLLGTLWLLFGFLFFFLSDDGAPTSDRGKRLQDGRELALACRRPDIIRRHKELTPFSYLYSISPAERRRRYP